MSQAKRTVSIFSILFLVIMSVALGETGWMRAAWVVLGVSCAAMLYDIYSEAKEHNRW